MANWYETNFNRDYYKRQTELGYLLGTMKSVRTILQQITNILLDGCKGLKAYTIGKKALICSLKVHILKKFATALRALRHGLYTSKLLCYSKFQ